MTSGYPVPGRQTGPYARSGSAEVEADFDHRARRCGVHADQVRDVVDEQQPTAPHLTRYLRPVPVQLVGEVTVVPHVADQLPGAPSRTVASLRACSMLFDAGSAPEAWF